jgi:hypothetical protein
MQAVKVSTAADLVKAVRECPEGTTIEIGPGIYELEAQLELKSGMTLKGAGVDKTIITHAAGWKPSTDSLPDPEVSLKGFDTQAYLIRLKDNATDITISDLTLRGPHLHGAIFGWNNKNLLLQRLRIVDFLWSGVRTFIMLCVMPKFSTASLWMQVVGGNKANLARKVALLAGRSLLLGQLTQRLLTVVLSGHKQDLPMSSTA